MTVDNSLQKKRRGRPATGNNPVLATRLPQAMIDAVNRWADRNKVSKSAAIRLLLETALASSPPKHNARMAPLKSEPPGMERDSKGHAIPMKERTAEDRTKAKRKKTKPSPQSK
jgi:hypothetical protein